MMRKMKDLLRAACVLAAAAMAIAAMCAGASAQQASKPVRLEVDLREAPRRVYHAKMEFPVRPGPFTLVYPKWIPGEHATNRPIVDVTGVKFFANGRELAWRRDTADMYAFGCDVPAGAETIETQLDYLLPV